MRALYISPNSFQVEDNKTIELIPSRRVKLVCGDDGIKYATIISSVYTAFTVVVVDEEVITINLEEVFYSVVKPGAEGNLAPHFHSISEGDGGYITYTFNNLTDVPTTYSGSEGYYAQSTGSGIVWSEVHDTHVFTGLSDVPTSYSGTGGKYAQSTGSGIVWSSISQSLLGLSDTPDSYENYKFLKSTVSGTAWSSLSFVDLVDVPATYSGSIGLIASSTGSGIIWTVPAADNNFHGLSVIDSTVPVVTDELLTYDVSIGSYNKITISGLKESLSMPKYSYDLIDMPKVYSNGYYLKSTVSGTEWAEIETGVSSFLSLTDTFDMYSDGHYLRTTYSGVTSVSGIILKAPNNSEWLVRVTDTGVLYTTEV